ncbi:MAG TPA: cation:proton antiporter family protein [Gammaproteobacteria bacterium]|nr:cation:proton antiporter family protein [Gammaproteobacteria bacterium]
MLEALWIAAAFMLGLAVRQLGLPPLIGYLGAGMLLRLHGVQAAPALPALAHAGVLLLLFSVGLKLRLRNLLDRTNLGGGSAHLLLVTLALLPVLNFYGQLPASPAVTLAIALAFSSTVLAAKVLDERRELRAFHGRVSVGILVFQDLVAVTLMCYAGGSVPSAWSLALLALPLLRPLLHALLRVSGHDELLVLFGLLLALAGGAGFERLGLSPELGALALGILISGHDKATELGDALWSVKEAFLVGFFLQIGITAQPDWQTLLGALLLTLALPVKAALFFIIMLRMRLRARSAFLASLSLASYSEFGLIVANKLAERGALPHEWVLLCALAMALSFILAAPLNRHAHALYEKLEHRLTTMERHVEHVDDEPLSLGQAQILIMGMGRVGTGAYDFLSRHERVVGLDSDPGKVEKHRQQHRRVLYADAEDPGFWTRVRLDSIRAILLTMPDPQANEIAARQLRRRNYHGLISAASRYPDEREPALAAGVDMDFNVYDEAGVGFAEHVLEALYNRQDKRTVAAPSGDAS